MGGSDASTARTELVKVGTTKVVFMFGAQKEQAGSTCTQYPPKKIVHMYTQAFLVDILEDNDFLARRRKLLRQRAGLSAKDIKQALAPA